MAFTVFTWTLTVTSLIGVVLNIQKRRACFYIWLITNASWCVVDAYRELPAQAALFAIYAGLAVWGIVAWRPSEQPIIPKP